MRIAVVGAGSRCLYLIDIIDKYEFKVISPVIVAVADIKNDAVGLVRAREKGLFVSNDYNDFFTCDNIDLIVELTGNLDIYNDILSKKSSKVRTIAHTTARLFWEIDKAAQMYSKTNQELSETQALYDAMINELILEDVTVIDLDYKILDINETFLKKLGLTRDEVIGHYCYEITHHRSVPCSGNEHPCPLANVKKTGQSSKTTHVHLDTNGKKHYVSISCYPLVEKNELKGIIELSKDITREIEFEKQMMQQEKLVSIGRLSAGVAHEINNPLTTILTSSMLIQEDLEKGTEMYEELTIISKEALRCRKIVKSLLDFARQSKAIKKPDNINEVIQESVVLTRKQANFKDVSLNASLADNLPMVAIDRDQIQQTIINLTLNAIEATPPGGQINVSSQYLEKKKTIEIIVSDTGEGIHAEDLNKIFDPFFTTKKSGTGLGLTITHGIIEQHGGTIVVKSALGKGTNFHISLPEFEGSDHDY
ncbi:ATP-binding protein [Desulfobacula sp.]|uniref:two-component system sensor histidine kinase NtrB n=1 Tax=Desulfobacula sp. TaxID=2593537 RepID=UPI002618A323|nr:ATP-binding protein [Desulfobacula sp.]